MDYNSKPEGYYIDQRLEMFDFFPKTAKTVLDVGCGEGRFGAYIKSKTNAEVWGIEFMEAHAEVAQGNLDKMFVGKCEDEIPKLPKNYFDVIYFNDILEHLVEPEQVLQLAKRVLKPNGIIISSIPNIRFHRALFNLVVKKDWKYEDYGIMDRTHLRFFTNKSIRRMYEENGFKIVEHKGINKAKSLKPYLYNVFLLFTALDILNSQYATVVKVKH